MYSLEGHCDDVVIKRPFGVGSEMTYDRWCHKCKKSDAEGMFHILIYIISVLGSRHTLYLVTALELLI